MNIHQELTEATRIHIQKASEVYGRNFNMPAISLHLRGVVAGKAYYKKWLIKYNPDLYIKNKEIFLQKTVPHEVAHLITSTLYPNSKSHGWEWRSVMRKLEVEEVTRCHSYDVSHLRPYVYKCPCSTFHLSKNIHNKMLRGQKRHCLKCKNYITYVGVKNTVDNLVPF